MYPAGKLRGIIYLFVLQKYFFSRNLSGEVGTCLTHSFILLRDWIHDFPMIADLWNLKQVWNIFEIVSHSGIVIELASEPQSQT